MGEQMWTSVQDDGRKLLMWGQPDQPEASHVVPWVARWSDEAQYLTNGTGQMTVRQRVAQNGQTMDPRQQYQVVYTDGGGVSDEFGVLWAREGITRGGQPQYSMVNAWRQRQAMRRAHCQVCGSTLGGQASINWLMPERLLRTTPQEEVITSSPPTCDACIPLALSLCPALKRLDWRVLTVHVYELWGVVGQTWHPETPEAFRNHQWVPYRRRAQVPLSQTVAQQQVVQLLSYDVGDLNDWA